MTPARHRTLLTFAVIVTLLLTPLVLLPVADAQQAASATAETVHMDFVGSFTDGYVGPELYAQPAYAIIGHDGGVSVLDTANPASPTKISHWDTYKGFPDDIKADGGLVYATVGRLIGLDGDYMNGQSLTPGVPQPLDTQDQVSMSSGAQLELTGDCVLDLVLLLLIYQGNAEADVTKLIPDLLAAHPDLCSTLAGVQSSPRSTMAAAPSRISLTLQQGGIQASGRFADLTLDITTENAEVTSRGLNSFTVSFDRGTKTTSVATTVGSVHVALADGTEPSIELAAGWSVDVTPTGFGPIQRMGSQVFLPIVSR